MKTLIVIPVRMASRRFPNKPMALIKGKPMIQRVWEQAVSSNIGDVIVACSEKEVHDLITSLNGEVKLTDPNLSSGTDRVYAAIQKQSNSVDSFPLSEITITDIQNSYGNGSFTVRQIVELYLDRIENIDRNGPKLNSIIIVNPNALQIADSLDQILKLGNEKGALFGIPVLLKDNIDTHDQMPTTAGSRILNNSYPPHDSWVAKKLRDAGAVIIGG